MMNRLAHQGGWDEIAMVAGPLVVFAAVLYLANRRANHKLAALTEAGTDTDVDTHHDAEGIDPTQR